MSEKSIVVIEKQKKARVVAVGPTAPSRTLQDFADDTAAGAGGIQIGEWYRTGNAVKVRIT